MPSQWTKAAKTQKHAFFRKLPPEMRDMVLSHVPDTEVSALRKYCQELHDIVAAYESPHATPQVNLHMRRLQNKIDAIKNTSLPTDAETLLAGLNIWTSTRGIFKNSETSLQSLEKWFSYLAGGRGQLKSEPYAKFEIWALVAMQVLRLQIQMRDRHNLSPRTQHLAQFEACLSSINDLPLSKIEIRAVFDRIRGDDFADLLTRGIIQEVKGEFHFRPKERDTFPGHYRNKFRISSIRDYVGNQDNPRGNVRGSLLPARALCGYLGLPKLPGSKSNTNTFCYYVKKRWVTELLKKRYQECKNAGEMNPLMKARVLQWVEIF